MLSLFDFFCQLILLSRGEWDPDKYVESAQIIRTVKDQENFIARGLVIWRYFARFYGSHESDVKRSFETPVELLRFVHDNASDIPLYHGLIASPQVADYLTGEYEFWGYPKCPVQKTFEERLAAVKNTSLIDAICGMAPADCHRILDQTSMQTTGELVAFVQNGGKFSNVKPSTLTHALYWRGVYPYFEEDLKYLSPAERIAAVAFQLEDRASDPHALSFLDPTHGLEQRVENALNTLPARERALINSCFNEDSWGDWAYFVETWPKDEFFSYENVNKIYTKARNQLRSDSVRALIVGKSASTTTQQIDLENTSVGSLHLSTKVYHDLHRANIYMLSDLARYFGRDEITERPLLEANIAGIGKVAAREICAKLQAYGVTAKMLREYYIAHQ